MLFLGKSVSDKSGDSCIQPLDVPIEDQNLIEFDLADVNEEQLVRTKNTRYQFDTVKDQDGFVRAVNIHRLRKHDFPSILYSVSSEIAAEEVKRRVGRNSGRKISCIIQLLLIYYN